MVAPSPSTRVLIVASDERQMEGISRFLSDQPDGVGEPFDCHTCLLDSVSLDDARICARISHQVREHRCHIVFIANGLDKSCPIDYDRLHEAALPAKCFMLANSTVGTNNAARIFTSNVMLISLKGSQPRHVQLSIINKVRWQGVARDLEITPEVILEEEVSKLGISANQEVGDTVSEIRELLMYLCPSAKEMAITQLPGVSFPSLEKRQTKTIVLNLRVDDRLPVILKITTRERIEHEVSNYREHIDGRLHGSQYARMEEHKVLWNFGAVVYHLLGGRLDEFKPLSEVYQEEDVEKVEKSIKRLFADVWKEPYARPKKAPPQSLFRQYDEVWSRIRLKQHKPTWSQKLRDKVSDANALARSSFTFPGIPLEFPNPAAWALANHERLSPHGTRQAITHGDLHADNVLVDEHGKPWLIDFERSGWGPILQDFVELECDLVTRLFMPESKDLSSLYYLSLILARPESLAKPLVDDDWLKALKIEDFGSDFGKVLSVIGTLRSTAARLAHDPDMREYLWGLLMNTLFLVAALEPETIRYQRALLFGSVLCRRLSDWRNNARPPVWPPPEWDLRRYVT